MIGSRVVGYLDDICCDKYTVQECAECEPIPHDYLKYELTTDAVHYGTGATLYQRDCSKAKQFQLKVSSYYSHIFSARQDYSTTPKECLANLKPIKHNSLLIEEF